jgi:hypothetical protein
MAHFLEHISCEACGSSDGKAIYSDGGSFCFSCRRSNKSKEYTPVEALEEETLTLPPGLTQEFGIEAVEWFKRYDLDVNDMLKHGLMWHEKRKQLVFPFYNKEKLACYQARNFSPTAKSKSYTKGSFNSIYPVYEGTIDTLVLVEDPTSAIKVHKYTGLSTMPCLGSGISKDRLAHLAKSYKTILVWLDSNMLHSAMKIASQLTMLGCTSKPIFTMKDPKECSIVQIRWLL